MIPRTYAPNESINNPGRYVDDPISCTVIKEYNGAYELTLSVTNKADVDRLTLYNVIMAKPDNNSNEQPFRIYSWGWDKNIFTAKAKHLTFDFNAIPMPYWAGHKIYDLVGVLQYYLVNDVPNISPINIITDFTQYDLMLNPAEFGNTSVGEMLTRIGDTMNGNVEIIRDKYQVKINHPQTRNRGVVLFRNRNITYDRSSDDSNTANGIMAYTKTGSQYFYTQPQIIQTDSPMFPLKGIVVDMSEKFSQISDLNRLAKDYIDSHENSFNSYTRVNVLAMDDSINPISAGDTIRINTDYKFVSKTEYDVLRERTIALEFDSIIPRVGDIIWTR